VCLFLETHLKPHERNLNPNYHLYWTDSFPGRKGGTAVPVREGTPHNHVDLPPLVSTEATEVCMLTGNSEALLAAVYNSPGNAWGDADIIEHLGFRHKSLLEGDLNAEHPFWNSIVSSPLGMKLLNLLHKNEIKISAPQCPSHYSPTINGDMFKTVMHKNVQLAKVTVSNILNSNHLTTVFHLLDPIRTRNHSDPVHNSWNGSSFKTWPLN
jgi:hypothetical protein